MIARSSPRLRRYWFTLRDPPASGYSLAYGVTAFDYDDAIRLLREKVFAGDVPEIDTVQEDVDVSSLDERHVLPNIAPPNWRGVWYPMGFAEARNRARPPVLVAPIIVEETGDLMIFDSATAAEHYLEWIDVEDGRFRGWDSEGRPLILSVVEQAERGFFRTRKVKVVALEQVSDVPTHAATLRAVLAHALSRGRRDRDSIDRDLPELLEEARRLYAVPRGSTTASIPWWRVAAILLLGVGLVGSISSGRTIEAVIVGVFLVTSLSFFGAWIYARRNDLL